MNNPLFVCFGDALVNGLAAAGLGLIAYLLWEMVRELRKKRRRRMKDRTARQQTTS